MPLPLRTTPPLARAPGPWPRTHRPSAASRVLFGGLGVLVAGGGLFGVWYAAARAAPGDARAMAVVCGLLALLGAGVIALVQVERIVLHPERLEVAALGRARTVVRRDEIAGWRLVPLQYGLAKLVLELRGQDRRPVEVSAFSAGRAATDPWFDGLPDLDALDRERAEAELLRSAALGADVGERRAALASAHRVAWALRVATIAAGAWAWLHPRPYPVVVGVLVALPLVALAAALAGGGRYALEGQRQDVRPELLTPIVGPGLVLGLRALLDLHLVAQRPLWPWVAAATLTLTALLLASDAALRRRWWKGPLMAALLVAYPWATAAQVNVLLDRSPGQRFEVPVLGKQISRGKVTRHELRLAPWGPVAEPELVDVDAALFGAVEPGGTVCVELHAGALDAGWFLVRSCR